VRGITNEGAARLRPYHDDRAAHKGGRLRATAPDGSGQDAKQRFADKNLSGFLQKPFSVDTLCAILRQFSRK